MKQLKCLCVLLFILLCNPLFSQSPNVVVIIADDMGWSEVSTGLTNLNNPSDFYETPVLGTLASEGIAFPNAYVNGANCAPTRAAILSGQFGARSTNNIFNVYNLNRGNTSSNSTLIGPDMGLASNSNIDEIPSSAVTIAETMKTAGYTTGHWGKYHVGEDEASSTSNNAPTDQGFDYNYGGGTPGGPGNYFASSTAPYVFHSNIGPELDPYASPYTAAESLALAGDNSLEGSAKHVTDALADAAIDFMETEKNTPFFMHFSNFAIHGPTGQSHARPDLYAKYVTKNNTSPSAMGHTNLGIAAILEGMDQTIGRIIDYLKVTDDPRNLGHKLSENTLVYFISDNGGAVNTQENGPLKGMKGEYTEGGIRSVTIAWSEASWLANKGTVNNTPIIAFDLYPTLAEMAGASLPVGGYAIDGSSQWQMLTNGTSMTREAIFWHFPGYLIDSKRDSRPASIVRKGDYKLRYNYESLSYELYNLISDIGESNDLLSGSPDSATLLIANDMSTLLRSHLIDTSAPLPTYRSDGTTVALPYIISTTGGLPNSQDGCQAINGYTAYWDFDSSSNANDVSSNGNDANPVNGVLTYDTLDFKEGDQSVIFDGTVDINYSSATFISQATSARTISAWIKPTGLTGIQNIFEEGGNTVGIALRLNGSNLESVIRSSLSVSDNISAAFPNDGDWHHVALVYDGVNTSQKLYIDGVESANSILAPASIASHNETGGGIGGVIGNYDSFANAAGSYFIGKMDAFSVYDSVLSSIEIEDASCLVVVPPVMGCEAPLGYESYWNFDVVNGSNDGSGNGHNPVVLNGTLLYDMVDFKEGDQSAVFNGTVDIQYSSGSFLTAALTTRSYSVWIKPTALSGFQVIMDEGGGNQGLGLRLNGSNLEGTVRSGTTNLSLTSAAYPSDGEWHHVAMVYDGGITSLKLYIDGAEVSSENSALSSIATHAGIGGIGGVIGGKDPFGEASDSYYIGKMDAYAVYDNALTLAEIEEAACLSSQDIPSIGPDVTICEGDSTVLVASGGTSYLWSTGATTPSISVNPTSTTTYTVTVSDGITNDNLSVTVTVNALPIAFAGADVTIDVGILTTLTATGGGTYLWSTGATTASIDVSPISTTTYTVTVTQNECNSNDEVIVTVNSIGCTYSIINSEGFESDWGIWNDGGSDASRDADTLYATSGSYTMRLRDNTSTSVGTTDNLDLTIYDEITVDFGYYCRSMDNSNEDFWLQLSDDGGTSFVTIEEWNTDDEFVNDQFYSDQVVISGPFTSTTQLRFRADASGNSDWVYLDDIVISGCSSFGSSKVTSSKKEVEFDIGKDLNSERISSTLYPNPFNHIINIKTSAVYKNAEISIVNVLGQIILNASYSDNQKIEIPTEGLSMGQYIINLNIDNHKSSQRIIKK